MIVSVAFIILWAAVFYLALLGIVALILPLTAHRFLGGFAQTESANLVEASVRLAIGISFVVAASQLAFPIACHLIGGFLAMTAILMFILPVQHRRLAARSVARVRPYVRLIGLASLGLAGVLAAMLWSRAESVELIPILT